MAAWKTGHRPGAGQQQWAHARVNSFISKGSGTWGKADKDLAAKARASKKSKKENYKYDYGSPESIKLMKILNKIQMKQQSIFQLIASK